MIRAYLNEVTDPTVPAGEVGEKVGKGVYEAMKLFLKPFVGPAIFTDKLMDVTFGQGKDYETGRMIKGYNPSESPFSSGNLNVAFKHIGSGLIPKELSDDISLAVGKKSEKYGRENCLLVMSCFQNYQVKEQQYLLLIV